ncbi:MAG: proline dehydrogenase family protein [Bacteroidota bacterium]
MNQTVVNFDDTSVAFAAKSDADLFKTYLLFSTMKYPWLVKLGTAMTNLALALHLPVKGLIRKTLFQQFCGGETIEQCRDAIEGLGAYQVDTILDYSVEGQATEESFDATLEEALRVADFAAKEEKIPFCVIKLSGLGDTQLMAKRQAGEPLTEEELARYERFEQRVHQLAARVAAGGTCFMIDAEETWIQEEIDRIAYEMMRQFNRERAVVVNTYQLYRHAALGRMQRAYEELSREDLFFGAKLVRGAYMEKERERAEEMGYEDPIQKSKEDTDRDYNLAIDFALDHIDRFSVCVGTHNEYSSAYVVEAVDARGISPGDSRVYLSQLLGMSDNISYQLAHLGFNVAKYVPYGPVQKVLPYLFRRADENTSIAGQSGRELSLVKRERVRRRQLKDV